MLQRNPSSGNESRSKDTSQDLRPKSTTEASEMNQSGAKFLLLGFAVPLLVILLVTWLGLPEVLSAWIARFW